MNRQSFKKRNNTSAISGLEVHEVRSFLSKIRSMYISNKPFFPSDIVSIKCECPDDLNDLKKQFYNKKTGRIEIKINHFTLMFRQGIHNKRHNKNSKKNSKKKKS
jgi:hypothetical protein